MYTPETHVIPSSRRKHKTLSDYIMWDGTGQTRRQGEPLEIKRDASGKLKITIPGRWTGVSDLLMADFTISHSARLLGSILLRIAKNTGKVITIFEKLCDEMTEPSWVNDKDIGKRNLCYRKPSVRSIGRWVKELECAGWLTWEKTMFGTSFTLLHPVMEKIDLIPLTREHAPPVPTDRTPVPTDRTPVPTDRTPVPTDRTPVPTDRTPVPTDRTPVSDPSIKIDSIQRDSHKTQNETRGEAASLPLHASSQPPVTPTERFLIQEAGFSATAAYEFRDIALNDIEYDLDRRLNGTDRQDRNKIIAGIIKTWRRVPPIRTVQQRIAHHDYDDPEVRAYLDARDEELAARDDQGARFEDVQVADQDLDDDEELIVDIGPNDEYEVLPLLVAAPMPVAAPVQVSGTAPMPVAAPVQVSIDTSAHLIRPSQPDQQVQAPRTHVDTSSAQMPATPAQEGAVTVDAATGRPPRHIPFVPGNKTPIAPPGYVYALRGNVWELWERCEQPIRIGLRAALRAEQRERDLARSR